MRANDALSVLLTAAATQAADEAARKAVAGVLPHLQSAAADGPGKAWLTNREARDYFGVSNSTLARWRADGVLPYSKVGQAVYYALADVEALLEGGRVRA